MTVKMNQDAQIDRRRFINVKDVSLTAQLSNRVEALNEHGVQVWIHQNKGNDFDLTVASKTSNKARGRQNLTLDKLREYLNVMYDAFKMQNE